MKQFMIVLSAYVLLSGPMAVAAAPETQREVAERISHDAERAANRGDKAGKEAAERAAKEAREASSVEKARQIEKDYNAGKK